MKIQLLYIGKPKKNFYTDIEKLFVDRISHYCNFSIVPISPPKVSSSLSIDELKNKEELLFKSKLNPKSSFIILDEKGKEFDSNGFSNFLSKKMMVTSDLTFIIGGAFGVSPSLRSDALDIISLSKLTMPHHLARVVFLEQLYRAYTIIKNQSYHNN